MVTGSACLPRPSHSPRWGDAARVTINPAVAPSTAMASPIPTTRNRVLRLAGGFKGGGGGGGSGKSALIGTHQRNLADLSKR